MQRFEPPPDPRDIRHFRGAEPAGAMATAYARGILNDASESPVNMQGSASAIDIDFQIAFFFESSILKRFHGTL